MSRCFKGKVHILALNYYPIINVPPKRKLQIMSKSSLNYKNNINVFQGKQKNKNYHNLFLIK